MWSRSAVVELSANSLAWIAARPNWAGFCCLFCGVNFVSGQRLSFLGRVWAWLRHGGDQLGQADEVVGSGRQCEHPADARAAAMTGLVKAGNGLAPAKHLL